ncbi:Aspartate aminotransferase [Levilactobacillus zymae]|uniref:Aspartate aminotransferase n=1 Tax=Levilactobacillus zymae TaxID=267363 RepID=A0A1Y6K405_9LACO|nr:Aspartate aminotransferase [Levilactobacillus zymae]
MVNTILKEADLFCPNSVRINFTIYRQGHKKTRWPHPYECGQRVFN